MCAGSRWVLSQKRAPTDGWRSQVLLCSFFFSVAPGLERRYTRCLVYRRQPCIILFVLLFIFPGMKREVLPLVFDSFAGHILCTHTIVNETGSAHAPQKTRRLMHDRTNFIQRSYNFLLCGHKQLVRSFLVPEAHRSTLSWPIKACSAFLWTRRFVCYFT